MWSLSRTTTGANSENSDQSSLQLLVGKDYVVGRKDCAVLIKDDPSISRKHAVLSVQYDIAHLGDISQIPEVMLSDTSKYGTTINGVKVTQPSKLNTGDDICFGTHGSIFRIIYTPLVAVTSCLENSKKKQLKKQIHALGGHLLNDWKKDHVTYLVMDGLVFTIKVIHALAECCPVVTPSYFDELLKAIETKHTLPTPKMFLPPLKEESIKSDEPLFLPDNKRKSLFNGKTFFFLSGKQFKRTHEAIEMCGGMTVLLDVQDTFPHDRNLVKDQSCVMMVDQKERESLPVDVKEWITQLMEFLRSNKKRPIPESELGLAILQMTLTNYCNPNIDAVPAITQNIVCQSLNVGLDDMSQIYSPQPKQQTVPQLKKSSGSTNSKDEKPVLQSVEMKPPQSTVTPKRPIETRSLKEDMAKVTVKDTPENAMETEKPRQEKVSPIPETLNISGDGDVFVADTPANTSKPMISSYLLTNNNTKPTVADSIGFDVSRSQSSETSFKDVDKMSSVNVPSSRNSDKPVVVPDSLSLNLSKSETECEPTRGRDKRTVLSTNATVKEPAQNEGTVPDSVGLDITDTVADIDTNKSHVKQDVIPESMATEDDYAGMASPRDSSQSSLPRNTSQSSLPRSTSQSSLPRNTSQSSLPRDGSQTSVKDESGISARNPHKRRRMTEDVDGSETESKTIPYKRMKNESSGQHEVDEDRFSEGLKMDVKVEHVKGEKNGEGNDTSTKLDCEEPSSISFLSLNTLPDGFLSATRVSFKAVAATKEITKPLPVQNGHGNVEFNEDDLPRNLVVVDVVSLVVRNPREKRTTTSSEVVGKNFKKFKKQWYAGCERRLPRIISGSDLVVHHALSNVEHEDWFIEAREATQEQERRDRMEEQLFLSDAGLPQRRKRQAR